MIFQPQEIQLGNGLSKCSKLVIDDITIIFSLEYTYIQETSL